MHTLSRPSRFYLCGVVACAALITLCVQIWGFLGAWQGSFSPLATITATLNGHDTLLETGTISIPIAFLVLTILAGISQSFAVPSFNNQSYYLTSAFVFAAVLILPPPLLIVCTILAFIPEWIRLRPLWYVQTFNISTFVLAAIIAQAIVLGGSARIDPQAPLRSLLIAAIIVLASTVYLLLQHLLVAQALWLAHGYTFRKSEVLALDLLITEGALLGLGVSLAITWLVNPWLSLLSLAPLFAVYRALMVPSLRQQANSDAKTGLANSAHFRKVAQEELRRAQRFGRPLSIIVADLDLLRNINNTYGHLAGDVVLCGVASLLHGALREYDMAARFGGEEFALLLPETTVHQARLIAERLRASIAQARFEVTTSPTPIRTSISMGIAVAPDHGWELDDLIHQADLAVYLTKLRGRNGVAVASAESSSLTKTALPEDLGHTKYGIVSPKE